MGEQELILDYASPRKRSSLRMTSKSLLECRWVDDGLVVREWLDERAQAVVALVGSTVTVGLMVLCIVADWHRTLGGVVVFAGLLVATWAVVVPLVVQRNWSRTELHVRDGTVRLWMGGPLTGRQFTWRAEQVYAVRIIAVAAGGGGGEAWPFGDLGEIELLAEGAPPIRLFTDHAEPRLAEIGRSVDLALRGERPQPVAAEPRPDLSRFKFGATSGGRGST